MRWLLDASAALQSLLQLLVLPAVAMVAAGAMFWYKGHQQKLERKQDWGKMLVLLGVIFLAILLVLFLFFRWVPAR